MDYLFNQRVNLEEKLKEKHLFLLLDYDGTLTPIVKAPQKARLAGEVKNLLRKLSESRKCKVAIISGRAIEDIKNKVGLKNITYVGNHGSEIQGPKIKFTSPISPRCKAIFAQIKSELKQKLSSIKGVILEDKGPSLGIHFRLVSKKDIPRVKTIVHEAAIMYLVRDKVELKPGKMVLEIRPTGELDKGKAVLWLLARQKFSLGENGFLPIYLGDDRTDEDAFRALKGKGLTIFVGRPKPSQARYYLKGPREVAEFLRRILTYTQ